MIVFSIAIPIESLPQSDRHLPRELGVSCYRGVFFFVVNMKNVHAKRPLRKDTTRTRT